MSDVADTKIAGAEAQDEGPDAPIVDHVAPIFLSLSFACFAFLVLLFRYRKDGFSERDESQIFVIGWALIPAFTIALGAVVARARWIAKYLDRGPFFHAIALITHTYFWGRVLSVLHEMCPSGNLAAPTTSDELGPPLYGLFKWFGMANGALLLFGVLIRSVSGFRVPDDTDSRPKPLLARVAHLGALGLRTLVDVALPLAVLAFCAPFSEFAWPNTKVPYAVALLLASSVFLFSRSRARSFESGSETRTARSRRWAQHALILLFLVLLVWDPIPDVDTESHYYYLGPVAAVLGGKTLLVDVNCQYGVVVIYFIALVMKLHIVATSYGGLAQMLAVLLLVHYVFLYWLMLGLTRSMAAAAATVFMLIVVVHFGQQDYPTMFPSTGPLRFAFGYMVVASLAIEAWHPTWKRSALVLQCLALGLASVWSFESFVYVFVAYVGTLVFDAFHVAKKGDALGLWRRVVPALLTIALAHALLAIGTHARSHHWPHWRMYFDYILLYSREGFGTMLIPSWGAWGIVSGVYLLSVIAFGYRRFAIVRRASSRAWPDGRVLFALTALGITQFTYFLGRSHPNNLVHILTPAVLVAAGWLAWMSKRTAGRATGASSAFRFSVIYVGTAAGIVVALTSIPEFLRKQDHSLLSLATSPREITPLAINERGQDAARLITAYAKGRHRVALFANSDAEVDALLTAGKAQIWPLTYPPEDQILPSARDAILQFVSPLRENDIVYLDVGATYGDMSRKINALIDPPVLSRDVSPAEQLVFTQLTNKFAFRVVESTKTGMTAFRLVAKS